MFGNYNWLNLDALKNWNVLNGENFYRMFWRCSKLLDINGLEKWNVSKGQIFEGMFTECDLKFLGFNYFG